MSQKNQLLQTGTPTEKASEFLDFHLKFIMRNGNSYIKESRHFLQEIKNIRSIPDNILLVTADMGRIVPQHPTIYWFKSFKKSP